MKDIAQELLKNNCFDYDGPLPDIMKEKISSLDKSLYRKSMCATSKTVFMLRKVNRGRKLIVFSHGDNESGIEFSGESYSIESGGSTVTITECDITHENMEQLRNALPFTKPVPLGTKSSFGMGDRLGIASPGHIRASEGYDFHPIFPQQSIREMERTMRTPEQVMDDACISVFQEGFRRPFGADADHLKTSDDVRLTVAAGFTFFTIDPYEHLNMEADGMSEGDLRVNYDLLFEDDSDRNRMIMKYSSSPITLTDNESGFSKEFIFKDDDIMRIGVKYLPAVRHTIKLYELLCELLGGQEKFDFEMSVDETSSPTTPLEHLFVARELKDAGISPQSLAPRYVGEFQKGIDYIGDIEELRDSMKLHALIAKCLGPYKLSIHSGSDKFSVFPIIGELTGGMLHEKTAGTSYLEAVRVISVHAPELYREIHAFALTRFETDRASYHVTTDLTKIPDPAGMQDSDLPSLMEMIDARQLIHITYGSVLTEKNPDGTYMFYDRFMDVLDEHEEEHYDTVKKHFIKHIESLGFSKVQ